MKKLLASALLAGLMLGTTTQVFAATVTNLTLNGEATNDTQKQLSTTIAVDGDSDPSDQLSVFKLSNDDSLKTITVATDADSKDKFSGLYTGAVNFTFDYANPVDAEVPVAE